MNPTSNHLPGPRFKLGRILATPAALSVVANANVSIVHLLIRHVCGDWGDLSEPDREQNELAVEAGARILSSYVLADGQAVWVVTEWDRSVTTLLLPGDY
ncbi:hypothetical protein [Burkholderia ubonensis]|uniref:hypothetical protein n=1 Tax=Burkholderia ubonensis TaxID=101571 RepID=UPI0009B3A01D|nr:hypothetical protein [Burkholderia ubonensis]